MKLKRYVIIAFAVIIALVAMPASAGAVAKGLTTSDVQCVVESVYTFTLPPDASLQYPHTRLPIGQFRIDYLLLASGESLSVTLIPGTLAKPDGSSMPYIVSFDPPKVFDEGQIGDAYDIALEIDEATFDIAAAGTYTTELKFRVVSYPENKVVWQDTVLITTEKNTEDIPGEDVPTTGIWIDGYCWPIAIGVGITLCVGIIIFLRRNKTRMREKHAAEDHANIHD